MKPWLFLLIGLFLHQPLFSQSQLSTRDSIVLDSFCSFARETQLGQLPRHKRMVEIGRFFLGKPYRGGTLDEHEQEQLVINLQAFDCVTFVDNVLALALLEQYDTLLPMAFQRQLQQVRYRHGIITDYTSRLHYSTDWLHEMKQAGILRQVTPEGTCTLPVNHVFFISRNHTLYPPLLKDSTLVSSIKQIEREINQRGLRYIPKEAVPRKSGIIQAGDIILIATHKKGLDTAHVGIAIEKDGKIYLLHASISSKKVVITDIPLHDYLQTIKSHAGILIGRLL